ncbi:MAG: radical SAM family heme chaperone HemW, partial [Burkholderiales bacterium]
FSAAGIDRFLSRLRDQVDVAPDVEITLEANPGTAEAGRFHEYRCAGVNRLSLGVQSLDDAALSRIGRIHGAAEAIQAVHMAAGAGIGNVNVDLMYALPLQSVGAALEDLEAALELRPDHISWYQLTIEPNTVFYSQPPRLPDEDCAWEMQQAGQALLDGTGFERYEVSAYARPGRRCRHNLNYWEFGDYLGLGAGAHGKLTDVDSGWVRRFARHRMPEAYMKRAGGPGAIVSETVLGADDLILEFMLNACRLSGGFPLSLFTERTGLSAAVLTPQLDECVRSGLIEWDSGRVTPSELGQRYLNDLLQRFLPGTETSKLAG